MFLLLFVLSIVGVLIMASIDNLEIAVTRLTTSVDNAVRVLSEDNAEEARIQAAADSVNAQSDKLDAATAGR